jgi:hypothetical protein
MLVHEPIEPFSDLEWRFSACPDNQQHWCDVYEYARHNPRAVEAVTQYRVCGHWFQQALMPHPSQQELASLFFDAFAEFPKKAFLAIGGAERRKRCAALEKERLRLRAQQLPIKTKREVSKGMVVLEVAEDVTEKEWHRIWTKFNGKQGRRRASADRLRDLSLLQLYRYKKSWPSVLQFLTEKQICLFSADQIHLGRCGNRAVEDMKSVFRRIL